MSDKQRLTTICQSYFTTNNCPSGEKCILNHIGNEGDPPSFNSTQTEWGRTFTVLPFSDLRQQSIPKPPPISSNSKVSCNSTINSKSTKFKAPTANNIKHKNINIFHSLFPSLSKAQKKRNRRKGKPTTTNEENIEKVPDSMNEKNLCAKSKNTCSAANCKNLHGDLCDLCSRPVLHPLNAQFRREHSQQCVKQHEERMKDQLLTHRSVEKQCGICFEPVMAKKGDRRFAILPDCNHCFCLVCIKIWRKSAGFGKAIRKSCPECRVVSHYVCPSTFWVENKEDKAEVLQKYKSTLAQVDCKYLAKTPLQCPFGNKCFYKHCKTDGTPLDLGPPRGNRTLNFAQHQRSELMHRRREHMMDALFNIMNDSDDDANMSDDFDYDFEMGEDSDEDNFEIDFYP